MMMRKQPSRPLKLKRMLLLSVAIFLTSCASTTYSACPSLREYTTEEQDQLYVATSKLDVNNPVRMALDDYANLRNQVRACHGR